MSTTRGTWLRPRDLAEALDALRAGATVIGGGAALASESFGPAIGEAVIDLAGLRVPGVLGGTGLRGRDGWYVGAMTTLADLLADAGVAEGWPGVRAAVAAMATPEVRRVATVGGTVAARLPASDLLPVLCAYGATVDLAGTGPARTAGPRRMIPVAAYLAAPAPGIVVGVGLGEPAAGAFRRFAGRPGFAPAIASVAGTRRGPGSVQLWAGAAGPGPFRLEMADLPDEALLKSDYAASAWYRRRLLGALRADVVAELAGTDPACTGSAST